MVTYFVIQSCCNEFEFTDSNEEKEPIFYPKATACNFFLKNKLPSFKN